MSPSRKSSHCVLHIADISTVAKLRTLLQLFDSACCLIRILATPDEWLFPLSKDIANPSPLLPVLFFFSTNVPSLPISDYCNFFCYLAVPSDLIARGLAPPEVVVHRERSGNPDFKYNKNTSDTRRMVVSVVERHCEPFTTVAGIIFLFPTLRTFQRWQDFCS